MRIEVKSQYAAAFSEKAIWRNVKKHVLAAGRRLIEEALALYYAWNDPDVPEWAKVAIIRIKAWLKAEHRERARAALKRWFGAPERCAGREGRGGQRPILNMPLERMEPAEGEGVRSCQIQAQGCV